MPGGTTVAAATARKMASVNLILIGETGLGVDVLSNFDTMFVRAITPEHQEADLYAFSSLLGMPRVHINRGMLPHLLHSILSSNCFTMAERWTYATSVLKSSSHSGMRSQGGSEDQVSTNLFTCNGCEFSTADSIRTCFNLQCGTAS